MLQRPKVGETEKDLLEQEEEFLKQSGKEPTQKRNLEVSVDESKSSAVSEIVGEVMERSEGLPRSPNQGNEAKEKGFPALFEIDPKLTTKKKGKKSLFALQMEKNKKVGRNKTVKVDAPNQSAGEAGPSAGSSTNPGDTPEASGSVEKSALSDDVKKSIHEENLSKLSAMPEAEILEDQKKLRTTLDPKLKSLLKDRSKPKKSAEAKQKPKPQEVEMKDSKLKDEKIKETLRSYVGDKWVNMDFLEKEKLEWVGDIPSAEALQAGQSYSARFNFKGELQPFRTEIDVTNALYHHGDEPERPGYTIQELYQLSRSSVMQQRILALNTLANIIYKSKLGYYDSCFDGYLLHKLMEADVYLLLRYSLDENALVPSAINCLRRLLYNDTDEFCLDRLLGLTEEDLQPLIFDKFEMDIEDERELSDNMVIQQDLIKGALRTDLLTRFVYIFKHLPCDRETTVNAISCIIRFARHCSETCERVASTPELLRFIYSTINSTSPIYQSVKLLRIFVGQSRAVAMQVATRFHFNFLATFLDMDSIDTITKREHFLLKLECIYFCRNFIRCGYMKDDFISWTPCLVRLLRFYAEQVDIYSESDFDFELFNAFISLLRLCIREKLPIDNHYRPLMNVCVAKWTRQLLQCQTFNYSSMKALGSCFAYFIDYFETFGSDNAALSFIRKMNEVVTKLMNSPCFERMANHLTDYSHLLVAKPISRDPSNLPSLCSVYENGEDFVRIVNNQSTLPFFVSFVKYLDFSYEILSESKNNVELFVNYPAIRKYVSEIMKVKKNPGDWFERFELSMLTDIIQLYAIVNDKDTLMFGFRLLPMIRIDDEDLVFVMNIVTDQKTWNSEDDLFEFLSDIYLNLLYRPLVRSGFAMRYRNEAAEQDWPYKALTNLRGRDAVIEARKILRYLSLVTWREPQLLERVPYTLRYYHLCSVFLTDSNVFDAEVQGEMRCNFYSVLQNRDKVDLTMKVNKNKSFFDFYTELITQYAAVSYGMHIFAELILFPLQNRFDISFRKLLWFEYIHVLKVITLPNPAPRFMDVEEFVEPFETDESLLVAYLNSISTNVISKHKNPFVYSLAIANINNYMNNANPDSELYNFLSSRIRFTISERIKRDLTSW